MLLDSYIRPRQKAIRQVAQRKDDCQEVVAIRFNKVMACYCRWVNVVFTKRPNKILREKRTI